MKRIHLFQVYFTTAIPHYSYIVHVRLYVSIVKDSSDIDVDNML